jgi:hypothetical protein
MHSYRLNDLGDADFESMVQALLKRVIGPGTTTFGPGRDGAREATFIGKAAYPSTEESWTGQWIFQVKYHNTDLVGVARARSKLIQDARDELDKLVKRYKLSFDNYILITNVPLSGVPARGTIDRLDNEVFNQYRQKGKHIAVWGADDVNRFLDIYPEVRTPYLPLLVSGDIIAHLMHLAEAPATERATTIDLYVRAAFSRDANAQLDQAGDVSEDPIPLEQVFFDLDAYVSSVTREARERLAKKFAQNPTLPFGQERRVPIAYFLKDAITDRAVIVGGPGEGKSTIGQYLAQLHRATLLSIAEEVVISAEYMPSLPRIPFRVALREFAQWLADLSSESADAGSLDTYITMQISRLSSRTFDEKDLHEVLKGNPILLILDGLDEVTDATVRKRLIARVMEFIERASAGLHCNMQIVATTRPTGYNDQFDPRTFIHFRLHKLNGEQVNEYAAKWSSARKLPEEKAKRLKTTIAECLKDHQIRLLMTTPLQVTILILVINSGGTPPRQREALFDDYLDVIYKREKAKGLEIIKTEKELLIGLHKFVGYLLQEESTKGKASSAALPRAAYGKVVLGYLRKHDPYSPPEEIEAEWKAITIDAGERLVLLVESPVNIFGFELRSIQEFFAACYLVDEATDTAQRFERFSRIAYYPHWRNVTLFFAGRVGRSNPGEAANVVEVCRQMDHFGIDQYIRRGAELALELASERALGPNRPLQRSLLEHGLELFDSVMSDRTLRQGIELVKRLPPEDIRDHVLPILERRVPILGTVARSQICQLLGAVACESELFKRTLLELATETGAKFLPQILTTVSAENIPSELRLHTIQTLIAVGVDPATIGRYLADGRWPQICSITKDFASGEVDPDLVREFSYFTADNTNYLAHAAIDTSVAVLGDSPLEIMVRSAALVGASAIPRYGFNMARGVEQAMDIRDRLATQLPDRVREGRFVDISPSEQASWLMWLAHLSLGDVTKDSWKRLLDWTTGRQVTGSMAMLWAYSAHRSAPLAVLFTQKLSQRDSDMGVIKLAGANGMLEWLSRLNKLAAQLQRDLDVSYYKFVLYGPGILKSRQRTSVMAAMSQLLPPCLHPIAVEWLEEPRKLVGLSAAELDDFAQWFAQLEPDSPWRRHRIASRVATEAVGLGSIMSPDLKSVLESLSPFMLADIAAQVASRDEEDHAALRYVLRHISLTGQLDAVKDAGISFGSMRSHRAALLRVLAMVEDQDELVHRGALAVATSLCLIYGDEESQRRVIRSSQLDRVQARLISSNDSLERTAGITLYSVRPPRSRADWAVLKTLLPQASEHEIEERWSWVLRVASEISNRPDLWVNEITAIVESGVGDELLIVLTDILRSLLPEQSQSIAGSARQLKLPTMSSLM